MFHCREGLYFKRTPNGAVQIIKTYDQREPRPDNVVLDMTLDAGAWASVIASASAKGEFPNGGWDRAVAFHGAA